VEENNHLGGLDVPFSWLCVPFEEERFSGAVLAALPNTPAEFVFS
jgi:hypothetical protein